MAATLSLILISSLLQGGLCGTFGVTLPQNIKALSGSCVTIPCSFDVETKYDKDLNDQCEAYWSDTDKFKSENAKLPTTKEMTGDLTKKNCTTTFNNASRDQSSKYYFRLDCKDSLMYTFYQPGVNISVTAVPPSPTLTPSTLKVKEGTSVSLTCSAPAPCWSHPPALTWTPDLGQSQETLQENQDKTKAKTSVVTFTASRLHHGKKISCTAVYKKQDGSADAANEASLTPIISFPPQILLSSDCNTTTSQVSCSCETVGNPSPTVQWYLNGLPVNQSGTFEILSETLNSTALRSFFTLNQPHNRDVSTMLCHSFNSLGFASQHFSFISAEHQGLYCGVLPWVLAGVFFRVSVICAAFLCKALKNVKPKEEDRTYMSLNRTNVSAAVYDVINTAPK